MKPVDPEALIADTEVGVGIEAPLTACGPPETNAFDDGPGGADDDGTGVDEFDELLAAEGTLGLVS